MTFTFTDPDAVEEGAVEILRCLSEGLSPAQIETNQIDIIEEPGRRDKRNLLVPGVAQNEAAATLLASELCAMANTPGGGAIVLGVASDGTKIGTSLDTAWLRRRIWDLTSGQIAANVHEAQLGNARVIVLTIGQSERPVVFNGMLRCR